MKALREKAMSWRESTADAARRAASARPLLFLAATHWAAGGVIVIVSVGLAARFLPLCTEHPFARRNDAIANMVAWDGRWYREIATRGYHYSPKTPSSVAFFPAYPLLAGLLSRATGLRPDAALLVVSKLCFLAAVLVFAGYASERFPTTPTAARLSVVALTWFPTTFYFRMAYSESLVLLLIALVFHGMRRAWPLWALATLVGLATAVRPVGVALLAPLAIHFWSSSQQQRLAGGKALFMRLVTALWALPLSCWGLLAFVIYQWWACGEPLGFIKTQALWNHTRHHDFFWERAARLVSLEPIRAVYDPGTSFYWALRPPREHAAVNMMFANPIYFLATVAAVGMGAMKRWLTRGEVVLAALLLLIPYVLRGDHTCMASQARFASVVLPAYCIWGRLLSSLSTLARYAVVLVWGALLATYSAFFVSWYWY